MAKSSPSLARHAGTIGERHGATSNNVSMEALPVRVRRRGRLPASLYRRERKSAGKSSECIMKMWSKQGRGTDSLRKKGKEQREAKLAGGLRWHAATNCNREINRRRKRAVARQIGLWKMEGSRVYIAEGERWYRATKGQFIMSIQLIASHKPNWQKDPQAKETIGTIARTEE